MSRVQPNLLPLTFHGIKTQLRLRLGADWQVGDRLPPIDDLARILGAGRVNTHRAVQELVKEGVLYSRRRLGTFVAPGARLAAPGASSAAQEADAAEPRLCGKRVAILAGGHDTFFSPAINHIRSRLLDLEASVISDAICTATWEAAVERHHHADALVLMNFPLVQPPLGAGQVAIFVEIADRSGLELRRCDLVNVDSETGGYEAGRHLRQIGCQSICFLGCQSKTGGQGYDIISTRRLRGCEAGFGAAVHAEHQLVVPHYRMDDGAQGFSRYRQLPARPLGVFAASDDLAMGFVHGAIAHGLRAGRDFQLVGFDGQMRGRQLAGGPLTTVEAPFAEMGREAARLLIERMLNPDTPVRRVTLAGSLFKGATTRSLT